jgi:hypothetical protein
MTDAELGDWHCVEVNAEGGVTKLELHENGVWQALSPTRDISSCLGLPVHRTITPNINQSKQPWNTHRYVRLCKSDVACRLLVLLMRWQQ